MPAPPKRFGTGTAQAVPVLLGAAGAKARELIMADAALKGRSSTVVTNCGCDQSSVPPNKPFTGAAL